MEGFTYECGDPSRGIHIALFFRNLLAAIVKKVMVQISAERPPVGYIVLLCVRSQV